MKRRLSLISILVLIAIAAVYIYYFSEPAETPPGQPALVRLQPENIEAFRQAFNSAADRTRLLVLLSPT